MSCCILTEFILHYVTLIIISSSTISFKNEFKTTVFIEPLIIIMWILSQELHGILAGFTLLINLSEHLVNFILIIGLVSKSLLLRLFSSFFFRRCLHF